VIVRGLPPAGPALDALVSYAGDPAADVRLVVVHDGAAKAKKQLDAIRKTGLREIACAKLTRREERLDFVTAEVARAGGRITSGAASALLDAVGADLRELSAACRQLVADADGNVDERVVQRYYVGRAEAKGWTVADRAVEGREAAALEELRWALALGTEPVLIIGSLAAGLRNVARVASRRGASDNTIASDLGMPAWKVRTVRRQVKGWSPQGIKGALSAVATADAEVKGAAAHPAYALERAVLAICAERDR
jgi:DNA polymerase-3 subunit delta